MTSRLACASLALLLPAGAAAASDVAASPPPSARSHLIPGELSRVDLSRRSVVVKTAGTKAEGREVEAWTGPDTRVTARGRVIRLEDLRPGDRVLVSCADEGGRHRARVVKVVAPVAVPSPAASSPPGPAPSPSPAAPGPGADRVRFD